MTQVLRPDAAERVLVDVRPHWRRLVRPLALVPVVVGVAAFAAAAIPDGRWQADGRWAVLLVALGVLALTSLLPWLRWRGTRLVVTAGRLRLRTGVLARAGRELPLSRLTDVSFHRSLLERLLGSGTLVVETAGETGRLVVPDVAGVEQVVALLLDLCERR